MSDRIQKALDNHKKGMNCCQAVVCAFADAVDADENIVFALGEGFGAGMGGMECTCGAVSGAVILAGLKNSSKNVENPTTKGKTYQLSKAIVKEFGTKNGSVICKELKGIGTGKVLRSCDGCISDAVELVEKILGL